MALQIVNQSTVDFVDKLGTDLTVVNAARVSFDKASTYDSILVDSFEGENDETQNAYENRLKEEDQKLLKYLATHDHWSPFAHAQVQLRITAPIFVARQLVKHQIGLVWNEVSRRYVSDEPTYFIPQVWRGKPINGAKQGSHGEIILPQHAVDSVNRLMEDSIAVYQGLMGLGVAPEQARMFLLQNMMTSWYWTGSLYACARVCTLRLDAHAQGETTDVAKQIDQICQQQFPNAWNELAKVWRNPPEKPADAYHRGREAGMEEAYSRARNTPGNGDMGG
jgi:thymidylate synthase (FAD)